MHDSVTFEGAGVPTAVIVLDGFKELAMTKRRQMGLEALEPIIVPGSLTSREVAREKAEGAINGLVEWLMHGGLERRESPAAAETPATRSAAAGS